jgi:hypothetical protein
LTWDFLGIIILSWEAPGGEEVIEGGHEAHLSTGGAGPQLGCATHARLSLGHPMASIFASRCSAWLKNTYVKNPHDDCDQEAAEKTQNTETEAVPAKIGGGNAARVAPDASPPSLTSTPSSPPWRGSSPPLDYGFVVVACPIFSCTSLFKHHMSYQHY